VSYDVKCYELASQFCVEDAPEEMVSRLAQHIQDAIEDFFIDVDTEADSQ